MLKQISLDSVVLLLHAILVSIQSCTAYYDNYQCFGTPQGDCVINTYMQEGGFDDPNYRWLMECQDQEALFGIYDNIHNFEAITFMWCKNVFPLKPPALGAYPYYPYCTYRDLTSYENYCFDWRVPLKTYDTFVTGFYDPLDEELVVQPMGYKCCRTPLGYHIDYSRCYYKYTHDQHGEHYDGIWLTFCDNAYHLVVGIGQAMNPWDRELHYVWIMCCPVAFVGDVDATTFLGVLTTYFGALDDKTEPIYELGDGASAVLAAVEAAAPRHAPVPHDIELTGRYGYALNDSHNIRYPNVTLPKTAKSVDSGRRDTKSVGKSEIRTKRATSSERAGEVEALKQDIDLIRLAQQKLMTGNEFVVAKHAENAKPNRKKK